MSPGSDTRYIPDIYQIPWYILSMTGPAQPLTTASEELDYLDDDLSSSLINLSEAWNIVKHIPVRWNAGT